MKIYIAGLDKAAVLAALWNNDVTAIGLLSVEEATVAINQPHFQYHVDLSVEPIDVTDYDARNFEGAAAQALEPLLAEMRQAAAEPEGEVRLRESEEPVNTASTIGLINTATAPAEESKPAETFVGQGGDFGGGGASGSFDSGASDSGSSAGGAAAD